MFRATSRLLKCRITLFTRENCSLCDTAKSVVATVGKTTPFKYQEVNVMEPGQEKWRAVYEFDTPVIHVEKASSGETTSSARKLMHRFKEEEVSRLIEEVERS
ncbi:glutaredoxin 2 [Westerdykella ornata]|uniref:Glutaredoxin-like protein n=1 Tax=Westerdykella ornata TaxID=318751 RepID=A0A6A6JD26_WESOR|nr:glutaredoxin 2 [Westerdykella ornata]KAF2274530.1 glutaredoxin 2 [Westerdykella ornata]